MTATGVFWTAHFLNMRDIHIEGKTIGPGHPVFVIAELGYNFSSEAEALESVDAAAECGVDALKIQTFRAETITTRDVDFPNEAGGVNQFEEFLQYEISEDLHRLIFDRCRERGLVPFSTPSHPDDVALLERVGVSVHKVGSDDLTNFPFIRHVGELGKPVIFSTGMATLAEVDNAVRAYREAGSEDLVVLQCVSNYPIEDPSQLDLRVIDMYSRAFPVHVGLSDHTRSNTAAVAAVALGAVAIEKHFVLSRDLDVPDAFFSADPGDMKRLVESVREAESMLGTGFKNPAATETEMRSDTRKGLVATQDLSRDDVLSADDVIIKRPGHGIAPQNLDIALGRTLRRDVAADHPITWDDL